MAERDFLDEMVDERSARNPEFPKMVDAAARRRELLRTLAERRRDQDRSQTTVAAEMRSSQSSVARLEGSAIDARLSTLDRYAEAVGYRIQWHLIPEADATRQPAVVVHPDQ